MPCVDRSCAQHVQHESRTVGAKVVNRACKALHKDDRAVEDGAVLCSK